MRKLRANLNYANVVATLALVVAVAGGSTAIALTAAKNSVTTKSIRDGNVTAGDLAGTRLVTESAAFGPLTARCSAKERLLSGGANQQGDPQARFFASYPDGNGWTAITLANPIPAAMLTVYALCLKPKPGG